MKLRLRPRAAAQIGKILGDLASPSPQEAASVSARLSNVLGLMQFPREGRLTTRRGIRRITIVSYSYDLNDRVNREEVVVLGI